MGRLLLNKNALRGRDAKQYSNNLSDDNNNIKNSFKNMLRLLFIVSLFVCVVDRFCLDKKERTKGMTTKAMSWCPVQ